MIDAVDQSLEDWTGSVVEKAAVMLTTPRAEIPGPVVALELLEVINAVIDRNEVPPPIQFSLRYLVTTWADEPKQAHRMFATLLLAAMEHQDFQVELKPLPAQMWAALGLAPRPAFMLQVPFVVQRPQVTGRIVHRPDITVSPVVNFDGIVVGPQDVPIAHARVELPSVRATTYTDSAGRFSFGAVPAEPPEKRLRVVAKGHSQSVTGTLGDEPLVIRFSLKEN